MSKRRKKKNKFARPFIAFLIIFTALFIPLNYLLDKVGDVRIFGGKTNLMDEMGTLVNENSPFFEAFNNSDRVNVLVMGINDNMTDTLMLASYDTENQKVDIISIPRDTYYERPGKSGASLKINSIYSQEGVLGTAKAVSKTLEGIPINYYVVVDYKGVEKVVDAMGGVKVNVPFHMKYRDVYDKPPLIIDIPAGERTLSRKEAIKFLRFRKTNMRGGQGYPQGDIGRIQTHQAFLKAAVDKAIGPKLPKVMKTFLAADLKRLAKATHADPVEVHARFLRAVLSSPSLSKAPAAFWRGFKKALPVLVAQEPTTTKALLALTPSPVPSDEWIDILDSVGLSEDLAAGRVDAREWVECYTRMFQSQWNVGYPRKLSLLVRRMKSLKGQSITLSKRVFIGRENILSVSCQTAPCVFRPRLPCSTGLYAPSFTMRRKAA